MTAREASSPGDPPRSLDTAVLVFGLVGGGALAWVLGLDAGWDHLNYYHYVAWALLESRMGVDLAPAQMQTYFNPLVVLPYYLIARGAGDHLVTVVSGAFQGLNLWLVWRIAWHLLPSLGSGWREGIAGACALAGFYGPANVFALGGPQGDNSLTVLLLGGLLIVVAAGGSPGRVRLVMGGLLVGIACGAKLTAAMYGVGAVVAFGFLLGWRGVRARPGSWALWAGSVSAGFALAAGPWMAYLASRFGNPIFPLYNDLFRSPWARPTSFVVSPYTPESLLGSAVHPFVAGMQATSVWAGEERDLRYALVFGLLAVTAVVALWRWRRHAAPSRQDGRSLAFLGLFFYLSAVLWSRLHADLRFLVPLEALAPLVVAMCLLWLFSGARMARWIVLASLLVIWIGVRVPSGERLPMDGTMFGVQVPAIGDPDGKVVVLTGDEPTAYVLPYFPEGMRFVRLGGNMEQAGESTQLTAEIRDVLQGARDPVFAVASPTGLDETLLARYDLVPSDRPCLPIDTKVGDGLSLCVLERDP